MPVLRFRVYWEEDDQVYRDIELVSGQTFMEFHQAIVKAFEFDGKHTASFWELDERREKKREFNSEVLTNKKDAPALSMVKTPVSALVSKLNQMFLYEYDPAKNWTFAVELINVLAEPNPKVNYPVCVQKEGLAPAQYGVKGLQKDAIMQVEEKYDLGADEMAEGYGSEGAEDLGVE